MHISRRGFLRRVGAAGVGWAAAGNAGAAEKRFSGSPSSFAVLHDTTLCVGCRACEAACSGVNSLPEPARPFTDLSVLERKRRTDENSFTVVNRYAAAGKEGTGKETGRTVFRKIQCNHCLEPACASACFVRAFTRTPEGAVIYDPSVCVGCRYCLLACPFNIPAYEYGQVLEPRVMKCTMCYPRIVRGLLPACVEACPMEALSFGKRDGILRIAGERIRKHPDRYIDHIYGQTEVGGTSWLYLSGVPFKRIDLREDYQIRPAPEFTAGALGAVPIVIGLWPVLLIGLYAMNQRKEKIAERERAQAVADAVARTRAEAEREAEKAARKAAEEREKAVEKAVKKALEEAAEPKGQGGA